MKGLWTSGCLIGLLLAGCAGGDSTIESNPFNNPNPTPNATAADDPNSTGEIETTGISAGNSAGDGSGGAETGSNDETGSDDGSGGPASCGDGVMQEGESCDGEDLGTSSCADFGFTEGVLVCDDQCNLLTDGCRSCGDGMLAASELCDGTNLGGETCQSQGYGGGTLQCDAECTGFNTASCTPLPTCGDGVRNGGEACDGADLGGSTCQSLGFDAGSLSCSAACTHVVTACEFLECGQQGQFCLFDENDPQGTCCPAGVGGNVLGICALAICQ